MHGSSHTYILITMWLILTHKNSKELQHAFNSKLNGRLYTIYTCIIRSFDKGIILLSSY